MVSGEKRNCEGENTLEKTSAILLDIEGTTTSISFVKDTLFPYVRENLSTYIESHWDTEEFKADLEALKQQAKQDQEDNLENFCPIQEGENEKENLIKNVLWQMDLDRKTTALKQLQGHIWREGYENGKLKGHVYNDVPTTLKKWSDDGKKIYVYSSGSVEAQKLLFKNSESGNLEEFFTDFFDTKIGPKTEASSYANIAKAVGCETNQILFLTDVVKEAVAADKAGMQVTLVIRDGNAPLTDDEKKAFATITSFKDLVFETSNKKKKLNEDEKDAERGENVETKEEVNNGESEKMEVDVGEEKAEVISNCDEEQKTEENNKDANNEVIADSENRNEAETENVDADIDVDSDGVISESNVDDKVVSSSVEESTESKEETASHEQVSNETSTSEKNEAAAEETPAPAPEENAEENMECNNETVSESTDQVEKTEESAVVENKQTDEVETSETNNGESGETIKNGHENGEAKETNEEDEGSNVTNESAANGKLENEIPETVPSKKVAPEDQADSTVKVTA